MNTLNIPMSPPIIPSTGEWRFEWLQWIQSPSFLSISTGNALGPSSGGTGTTGTPPIGTLLVGNGANYTITTTLPTSALPAFGGDASSLAGSATLTFATVNATSGSYGSGSVVSTFTVNGKGLITAAGNTNITGAPGAFTVVGGFGCNSKAAQTAVASGASVATTAATNAAPFGYTTAAQADRIVALVNAMQAALIANGILT